MLFYSNLTLYWPWKFLPHPCLQHVLHQPIPLDLLTFVCDTVSGPFPLDTVDVQGWKFEGANGVELDIIRHDNDSLPPLNRNVHNMCANYPQTHSFFCCCCDLLERPLSDPNGKKNPYQTYRFSNSRTRFFSALSWRRAALARFSDVSATRHRQGLLIRFFCSRCRYPLFRSLSLLTPTRVGSVYVSISGRLACNGSGTIV